MKRQTTHPDRKRRQEDAAQRKLESLKLTPAQRIAKLDQGGYAAKKERARLSGT